MSARNHAVLVDIFENGKEVDFDLIEVIDPLLHDLLSDSPMGEYDGHEVAMDGHHGRLYFYGPDADALYSAVLETLTGHLAPYEVHATLRYGDLRDPETVSSSFPMKARQ